MPIVNRRARLARPKIGYRGAVLRSAVVPGVLLGDRYEVVRPIAHGGTSEVFEASDRSLGRRVAVKLYRAGAVEDRQRFEAEVGALAGLNHPALVHLYDAGEHDGAEFLVLELIDGPALSSVLAEHGPLADNAVRSMGEGVADALAYVHQAGIVHRDVTPANILCASDGRPRLADFGIARLLDSSRLTAAAMTVGTAAYMAPEQVEGSDVTPAADVYALGLVLHEALSGRRAFDGVGHEVALARLARDPDVTSDVPVSWHGLLRDMTARQPSARPTAAEVRNRIAVLATTPADREAGGGGVVPLTIAAPSVGDALARTTVIPAAAGGTEVMPAAGLPAAERAVDVERSAVGTWPALSWWPSAWRRHGVAAAVAAAVVVVAVLALAAAGDSSFDELPSPAETVDDETVDTEPVPTMPTTSPPEPAADHDPDGEGKGKGRGKDDD